MARIRSVRIGLRTSRTLLHWNIRFTASAGSRDAAVLVDLAAQFSIQETVVTHTDGE